MASKRSPNQAMADTMAAWRLPPALETGGNMERLRCTECAALIDGYVPFTAEDDDRLFCDNCWDLFQEKQQEHAEYEPTEYDEWQSFDPDC